MKKIFISAIVAVAASVAAASCGNKEASQKAASRDVDTVAVFDGDTAYGYVASQIAMGPRVPGSAAHKACEEWIIATARSHGADTVLSHRGTVTAWNGDNLPMHNILARYNSGAAKRILLMAHYDTRPWSDQESDTTLRNQPVPGANDGGSGVAVLLEVGRHLQQLPDTVGVDLLFTDLEDYGNSGNEMEDSYSWGMGAQNWARELPYAADSLPIYGICVDMVGGQGARFYREMYSDQTARWVNDKVWETARRSGYGDRFPNEEGGFIIDDHVFVSRAGIPTIDIIEMRNDETGTFPTGWHTTHDDMEQIEAASLKAVGQTLLNLIYSE